MDIGVDVATTVMSLSVAAVVEHSVTEGLRAGRRFEDNLWHLDAHMHEWTAACSDEHLPVKRLVLLALEAAFLSECQRWLRRSSSARGAPSGATVLVCRAWTTRPTLSTEASIVWPICSTSAGGSPKVAPPAAGALRRPSTARFVHLLLRSRGSERRAPAPTISPRLVAMCGLRGRWRAGRMLRKEATALHGGKTTLVPATRRTQAVEESIRQWLRKEAQTVEIVRIAGVTKVLGFQIGPSAAKVAWHTPLAKWRQRVSTLADSSPPAPADG